MSAPKHRPKVINLRTNLTGLRIAAKESIVWPCHAFQVSIPQKQRSLLNIFEELILKMTALASADAKTIAHITCLEQELVTFVQHRLFQLDLLDSRYELSHKGHELLKQHDDDARTQYHYISATVFVDLISGMLLPYVHADTLYSENITSINKNFVFFATGSKGKSKKIRCHKIPTTDSTHFHYVPNSKDILSAVKAFKRKQKQYAFLQHNSHALPHECTIPTVLAEAISIARKPEFLYLRCDVLMQEGTTDMLVTDGYGFGFSESFAKHLIASDAQWIVDMKKKGLRIELSAHGQGADNADMVEGAEGGESTQNTPTRHMKYYEISSKLQYAHTLLQQVTSFEQNSSDSRLDYKQKLEVGVKAVYEALEWTLRFVLTHNVTTEWEDVLCSQNAHDNAALLHALAKKLGFVLADNAHLLLHVKAGAIRHAVSGKVDLQALLALCITSAASQPQHPFHDVARAYPHCLNYIVDLKKYRDRVAHGNTEDLKLTKTILKRTLTTFTAIIALLLPDIVDDLNITQSLRRTQTQPKQHRLKASVALESILGTAFMSTLEQAIKEQLLRAFMLLDPYTQDKAMDIITCLASAVQHTLFEITILHMHALPEYPIKSEALESMVHMSFYSTKAAIPQALSTVNVHHIERTLQGKSTTLGAHILSLFLLQQEQALRQLHSKNPDFVDTVVHLIQLRGHGNQQYSTLSYADMEQLKTATIQAIKDIREVFYDI